MLFRQQRRGYEHGYLSAISHRNKSSPQGHLGFAETHIAADQPVHGFIRTQILDDRVDGGSLIGCFLETKALDKRFVIVLAKTECMTLACAALSIQVEQFRSG